MDRNLIAVAVSSALALPMAADAVEFSASGQVNRALVIESQEGNANDGDVQHKDGNSSNTRFRFTGSEDMGNGWVTGVQLEWAALNGSDANGFEDDGRPKTTPNNSPTIRHANVYLSGAGGKVTIGQASTATDGMAHARLGGASWLGGVTNWCSYQDDSQGPASCPSNDGGRKEVLRYDTPALGPATVSASMGNDDYWDVKIAAAGSMGDSGYDLRVGYKDDSETLTASGAFSMGQGTAVAVAWSQNDSADHEYQYIELDHSYGDGSVGVYYKRGERAGLEGSHWGLGVGHALGGGATAYTGFRFVESDGDEDLSVFFAGMRVTFN